MAMSDKKFLDLPADTVFGIVVGDNGLGWQEDMGAFATRLEIEEFFDLDSAAWETCSEGCCGVQDMKPSADPAFEAPFIKLYVPRSLDKVAEIVDERETMLRDMKEAITGGFRKAIADAQADVVDPRMN